MLRATTGLYIRSTSAIADWHIYWTSIDVPTRKTTGLDQELSNGMWRMPNASSCLVIAQSLPSHMTVTA